jgi:hypothetical protein
MPTDVGEIVTYAGLTSRQTAVLKLLEANPTKGFTANEIVAAIKGFPPLIGVFGLRLDIAQLKRYGRVREEGHLGVAHYFLKTFQNPYEGPPLE